MGRSLLPYDAKHPLILHQKSPLSKLLAVETHAACRHAGVNYVFAHLKQRYWVVHGREVVKRARALAAPDAANGGAARLQSDAKCTF